MIHANLDAEARWAGGALPAKVAARVSYYAALTAALAPEAAEVWAPAAVDASRIRLPVAMRVGMPPRADLVWAQEGAKAANDRRLATALAAEHGIGVSGAKAITSADEIDLAGSWVVKAPWTSAGRDRAFGDGAPIAEQRTRIARLFERYGALVVERWMPRILDVGMCATIDATGNVAAEEPHRLITDARGTFLGIDLAPPALEPEERARLTAFVRAIGPRLGYAGPIALDAFLAEPGRQLCVCEINARYSFGWIARALHRRHGTTRLGFSAAPPGARELIAPADDGITAWIA
ncbi:hypothetical protein BH11MYX3_BH11MYX3_37990 [soil metagenome]